MALQHFLILYSLKDEKLVHLDAFGGDVDRATDAYTELEREYRDRVDHDDFEIVLVGADSLETVHITHSRYFRDSGFLVPFAV
ncbi:MAG: hypothetical protein ACRDRL_02100 [Sciscionella sp.]